MSSLAPRAGRAVLAAPRPAPAVPRPGRALPRAQGRWQEANAWLSSSGSRFRRVALGSGLHRTNEERIKRHADQQRHHGMHDGLGITAHDDPQAIDDRENRNPLVGEKSPARKLVVMNHL